MQLGWIFHWSSQLMLQF